LTSTAEAVGCLTVMQPMTSRTPSSCWTAPSAAAQRWQP
jgi:hypothetical protein